jgi:hypothetical protein
MRAEHSLSFATADRPVELLPRMANRHGLVSGATGTGKTVTLRVLAERFSALGVPVFLADIKGDLSGLALPGEPNSSLESRARELGVDGYGYEGCPVVFFDLFGASGHPVRTTVSEMGPLLLARLLGLNETQAGVLNLIFKIADDEGLLLLDLKDLRAMAQAAGDNAERYRTEYGNVSAASIGAIQRNLLVVEQQGGAAFFGEPALAIDDLIQTDSAGRGVINILAADRLLQTPALYSMFLLWLLSELFERLPEVGDLDQPKLVFFFDEAHLLFDDAPKVLVDKIEQLVRLIRSKGVGVYFVTQNPIDLPETVLGQLGNRVQHALRAYTPKDQKAVRAAAQTFRANPALDTERAIQELAVGEALVSVLDGKGVPTVVERARIHPPRSRLRPLDEAERAQVIRGSLLYGHYEKAVDRESAYEILTGRAQKRQQEQERLDRQIARRRAEPSYYGPEYHPSRRSGAPRRSRAARSPTEQALNSLARSAASQVGSTIGRQLIRGLMGSLLGGRR